MYHTCVLLDMNRQVQYTVMIASIATVLLSGSMFLAEAKTSDKDVEYSIKGTGINIFVDGSPAIDLQISPIEGKKLLRVIYHVNGGVDGNSNGDCIADEKILKSSSNKKASTTLNTADLDCKKHNGVDGIISASIVGDGSYVEDIKFDNTNCETTDGIERCVRDKVIMTEFNGVGTISGFGIINENVDAVIFKEKSSHTEWTNP